MHTPARHTGSLTKLAAVAALCAMSWFLAGCGASTNTAAQQGPLQQARQTPSLSNADIGGEAAQQGFVPASRRPGGKPTGVKVTDRVVSSGKVQKGRSSAEASKDDEAQTSGPRQLNPCTLVTTSEAESITGAAIRATDAPLGPTCIYSLRGAKAPITLAVETERFTQVAGPMTHRQRVTVHSVRAYCGRLGTQVLLVPVTTREVLSVTAPCAVAQRFASLALGRITA